MNTGSCEPVSLWKAVPDGRGILEAVLGAVLGWGGGGPGLLSHPPVLVWAVKLVTCIRTQTILQSAGIVNGPVLYREECPCSEVNTVQARLTTPPLLGGEEGRLTQHGCPLSNSIGLKEGDAGWPKIDLMMQWRGKNYACPALAARAHLIV